MAMSVMKNLAIGAHDYLTIAPNTAILSVLPKPVEKIIWENLSLSYSSFHHEISRGKWDLNPPHQREIIKPDEWYKDIITSNLVFGNVPDVYFHPVKQPNGTVIFQSIDGKQRCTAVVFLLDSKYTYYGLKFCDMSARDQDDLSDLKLNYKLASRELTPSEVEYFFRKFQMSSTTTMGEHINSHMGRNRKECFKMLECPQISKPLSTFQKKTLRNHDIEFMSRCLHCYVESTDKHYIYPVPENFKDWVRDEEIPDETFGKFKKVCIETVKWLAQHNKLIKQRSSPSVYIPVFIMFKNWPEMAPKFSEYLKKQSGKRAFSFTHWGMKADVLRAGGNEYMARALSILKNIDV